MILLAATTVVLAVAAGVGGAWWGGELAGASGASAEPTTGPEAAPPPSSSPSSPAPTPGPTADALPDECSTLYSSGFFDELDALDDGHMELNRTDFDFETLHRGPRLSDDYLTGVLWNLDRLQCDWDPPPTDVFIGTTVAPLPTSAGEDVTTALTLSDFTCSSYREGTLCLQTTEYAESSTTLVDEVFIRDGLIVATGYLNISVEGYLDDIVDSLWSER